MVEYILKDYKTAIVANRNNRIGVGIYTADDGKMWR